MKFRKIPVEIDAIKVSDALALLEEPPAPDWIISAYEAGILIFNLSAIEINTLEGTMVGEKDDWIIRGVQGELYPCKPDIFAATYESVD